MTITEPARAGLPWDDDDHETLVRFAKERADLATIARAVQRGESATWQRLRLLLPVEHRKCPRDRIVPALHDAVQQPGYDWRAVILQTPPPPPVHEIVRTGLDGLADDDLAQLAHVVALCRESEVDDLKIRLARRVDARGLRHLFVRLHVEHLVLRGMTGRAQQELWPAAREWFDSLLAEKGERLWFEPYDDFVHLHDSLDGYGNPYAG